jgi:hypothetical protein
MTSRAWEKNPGYKIAAVSKHGGNTQKIFSLRIVENKSCQSMLKISIILGAQNFLQKFEQSKFL